MRLHWKAFISKCIWKCKYIINIKQILGIDIRQKKEAFHLRGHKDIIREVKISSDGKMGISISSDKTVKLWDLYTHRVLKNWDYHQDSVYSLSISDNFTKFISGSKNGEIYFTDIMKSVYCKIAKQNEPITSLALSNNLDILATTSNSKIYEFVNNIIINM